jgi:DNA repair protein RadC
VGTINGSLAHTSEAFESMASHLAYDMILALNHPSGSVKNSQEDQSETNHFLDVGILLGIDVIDHILVTNESFVSFKEIGCI